VKVSRGRVSERASDSGEWMEALSGLPVGEAGARELLAARPGTEKRRQAGSAARQSGAYRLCGSARAERLVEWARWFSTDRTDPVWCAARLRSMNPSATANAKCVKIPPKMNHSAERQPSVPHVPARLQTQCDLSGGFPCFPSRNRLMVYTHLCYHSG